MKSKMLLVAGLVIAVVCLGASVEASNMGFKKSFAFTENQPPSNTAWISLPFFYTPAEAAAPGVTGADAEDLGQDLGGPSKIVAVMRYNPTSGALESHMIGSVSSTPFMITEGVGVAAQIASGAGTFTSVVVGSHNNSYTQAYTWNVPPSNTHWLSIPYHFKATEAAAPGVTGMDAEDLGQQLGGSAAVVAVMRYNPTSGALESHMIGSVSSTPFMITPGVAVAVQNQTGQNFTYTPGHY